MSVPADLPDIAPELEATHTTETSTNLVAEAQPSSAPPVQADFVLGNSQIAPGQRMVVDIPFGKLYTHTELKYRCSCHSWQKTRAGFIDYRRFAW